MLYCIFHCIVHAKHSHYNQLPSEKMNAACNANMTKRQLLIQAFSSSGCLAVLEPGCWDRGFPHVSAYIYMLHMQMQISVLILPCLYQWERFMSNVCVHLNIGLYLASTVWMVDMLRVLHLPRCCWHCNIQRFPDLSSQSSVSVLRLLVRSRKRRELLKVQKQADSYIHHKVTHSWSKVIMLPLLQVRFSMFFFLFALCVCVLCFWLWNNQI